MEIFLIGKKSSLTKFCLNIQNNYADNKSIKFTLNVQHEK